MTNRPDEVGKDEGRSQADLTRKVITTGYLEMEGWLKTQSARRQAIYRSRLGDPAHRLPLSTLATQLGISRERVRQVENTLMRHLRSYSAATGEGPVARLARALARGPGPSSRRRSSALC